MPLQLQLHLVPLALFVGLMVTAAFEDLRRFVIPNRLTLALCLLWPLDLLTGFTFGAALGALGCALAVLLVGAVPFSRGLVGGGDIKLLAVAALWAGPSGAAPLLIGTGVIGGLLALFLLSPFGAWVTAPVSASPEAALHSAPMPYGVAISAAALIVTIPPHFG